MGLLDLYTNFNGGQGSQLNYDDVTETDSPFLVGSSQASKLHADDVQPGYSLNGAFASEVNNASTAYNNGGAFPLGTPSTLDLNGVAPTSYPNPETGETYG